MSVRDKAKLNVCIAKDLAEKLNQKLKMKIADDYHYCAGSFAKAA
jgi:hypothetical protein